MGVNMRIGLDAVRRREFNGSSTCLTPNASLVHNAHKCDKISDEVSYRSIFVFDLCVARRGGAYIGRRIC